MSFLCPHRHPQTFAANIQDRRRFKGRRLFGNPTPEGACRGDRSGERVDNHHEKFT